MLLEYSVVLAHASPMGLPWVFHGIFVLDRGLPMGIPWDSHGSHGKAMKHPGKARENTHIKYQFGL